LTFDHAFETLPQQRFHSSERSTMKLGAYTACLHDRGLTEVLDILVGLGLTSVEVNAGGFIGTPHLPVHELLESEGARQAYLATFADRGLELTGLNCNGNPVHPDPEIRHGADLHRTIELAGVLGVRRVVTMSGVPGGHPGASVPNWVVNPWDSGYLDILEYQWNEVVLPYWTDIEARAAAADVKVCIEMHPQNVVFNPATLIRLITSIGATHIGAEMDPSHLFWQGIDPIAAVEYLGAYVFHAAAKDTRINAEHVRIHGVLDDRFTRVLPDENPLGLGGRYTLNRWPAPDPAWEFVAVGNGHGQDFWSGFLSALAAVDPDMAVNIEHEDASLGQVEGLSLAASNLLAAARAAGIQ
jgi:sugar phosphate isomerase/epimerase